jgi:putative spermidine/putrescine transport system ATP-binding protein
MRAANPITLRAVRKSYGQVVALRGIDLDIAAGEFLTLLGPSGSGKTTLLMVMAGFTRPDSGSVKISGREILLEPPHKRDIGLVFQNYALFPHMTVGENVAFPLRYRRLSRAERDERVRRALDLVRLVGFEERRIDQLSGGQKQRVALSRALVFEPAILLMDEPLSALDKKLREQMQVELRQLHNRLGTTTIYVTHDQREALTMSTRIAVMNEGAVVQVGAPMEVYEKPESFFVADFMGESQFLEVRCADGEVRYGGATLRTPHLPSRPAGRQFLLIRPEKIEIVGDSADPGELNILSGRVGEVLFHGEHVQVSVVLAGGERVYLRCATGRQALHALPRPSEELRLGLHPDDTIIVPEP